MTGNPILTFLSGNLQSSLYNTYGRLQCRQFRNITFWESADIAAFLDKLILIRSKNPLLQYRKLLLGKSRSLLPFSLDFTSLFPGLFYSEPWSFRSNCQGNELLIPGVSDAHARLPENCQKEALSLRLMRQETINGKGFFLQQVTRYIPLFRNIERKHLCTEFIPYPTDVFFVFLCVISTSAIYQYAARFQTRPDIRNNPPLPLPADFHILRAPLAYGNRVFAEHTLTGAGHVRQYHVEEIFQRCKVRRVAIGNHHIGMPPLGQILGKYLRAVADNIIGYQQTIVGKEASDMRRLTARSGAKVEHHYRFLTHILLQSLFNKHG